MARLRKLLAERKITIELDDQARTWLANRGYDPSYGARPLKRVIQKALQDPLAEMILSGAIADGSTLTISADADGLTIDGKHASRRRSYSFSASESPPPGAMLN